MDAYGSDFIESRDVLHVILTLMLIPHPKL